MAIFLDKSIVCPSYLLDRLRTEPIPSTVPGSRPVLFFGDAFAASVATIGINPSRQEYLSTKGEELTGSMRRFETLRSLAATERASLDDRQAGTAIQRMRCYFNPDCPVYRWFAGLSRVVEGMGVSFRARSAAHLDLVQEATDPVWSKLAKADPEQSHMVLRRDLAFLKRQIEEFSFRVVVCTSARVCTEINKILPVRSIKTEPWARLKWTVGVATLARGTVAVVGWNVPLAQATGLTREGQNQLGKLLGVELWKLTGIALT